jgi:HlyD family secretion protein
VATPDSVSIRQGAAADAAGTATPEAPAAVTAPVVAAAAAQRRKRRRWIFAGAAVLVVCIGILAWRHFTAAPAVQYATAPVTRGDIAKGITASGTVNPETTVQVGSYVSGAIESVSCDFNTQVKKGQLCAKIDPRPYQSTVDQDRANLVAAQAQLAKDQAALNLQKAEFGRAQALLKNSLISQDQFDAAKASFDQAQSQIQVDQSTVTQRNATLKSAQVSLDYTNIVSPVDGTVVSRNVTVGQTVAASFQTPTLFLIATDLTKMQVDTSVSEGDIGDVEEGEPVTFTVEAFPGRRFDGSVAQVRQAPEAVQNVVTYDVVATAANADLALKPGMTANVHIITERRAGVLRVPNQALRYTPGGVAAAANRTSPPPSGGLLGIARGAAGGGLRGGGGGGGRGGGGGAGGRGAGGGGSGGDRTNQRQGESRTGQVYVLRDGAPAAVPVTLGLDDDTYTEITGGGLAEGDRVIVSEGAPGAPGTAGRGGT